MVQSKIQAAGAADAQAVVDRVLAALDEAQPEGLRYASLLLPDGERFVALPQVDDGVKAPLVDSLNTRDVGDRRRAVLLLHDVFD